MKPHLKKQSIHFSPNPKQIKMKQNRTEKEPHISGRESNQSKNLVIEKKLRIKISEKP
jgi:hypothetical protein